MAKSYEDLRAEQEDAARELAREQSKQREKDAKEADSWAKGLDVDSTPAGALSGEAAEEHLAAVRSTMIFGDTDTTAGAAATGVDTPTSDNEAATVSVAAKDSDAAAGGEASQEATDAEARRQPETGSNVSADDVDEAAAEQVEGDDARREARQEREADTTVAAADDGDLTPQQKAARTRARNRAEGQD